MDIGSILLILSLLTLVGLFIAIPLLDEQRSQPIKTIYYYIGLVFFTFLLTPVFTVLYLTLARRGSSKRANITKEEDHELSSLMAERDRILNALKELDFDNAVGKVPAEIYPEQRKHLLTQGAETLRRIDELQGTPLRELVKEPELEPAAEVSAEERIEAAIAARSRLVPAYSAGNGNGSIHDAEDDIEVAIANRRRARSEKAGGFCPKCGKPVQAKDKFCPKCGTTL